MASSDARLAPSFLSPQVLEHRYFFNHDCAPGSEIKIVCGGWERCAPDYRIDRSKFAYYGIEYVASGRGDLTMHGVENKLFPGAVFAYGPSTPHTIRSSADTPLIKYFIDFSGPCARRIISRKVLGANGIAYLHDTQTIQDLYEQMLAAGVKGGPLAPRLCALLIEVLSLRIEENAQSPSEIHSRSRQTFDRCRAELQLHFRTLQSVSQLADRTHLDRAYLSRLFYRFAGENPHRMLTRLKMSEAAAQLFSGGHTVKEVGAEVGFSDPYHFSRVFKKHYGIAPGHFPDSRRPRLLSRFVRGSRRGPRHVRKENRRARPAALRDSAPNREKPPS
jgi:AraC-like DNA-binding protein